MKLNAPERDCEISVDSRTGSFDTEEEEERAVEKGVTHAQRVSSRD